MCKNRRAAMASDPKPRPSSRSSYSYPVTNSGSYPRTTASSSSSSSWAISADSKTSSSASLAALRDSLPETPTIYSFAEISAATNNLLARSLASGSSSSWRCSLRGKDAVIFQRPFRGDPAALPGRLGAVCKSHHNSLVRLLGVSLAGDHIYVVYEHSPGASLAECLRNPRNPNFTPLSSWMSRIQVAADLAQGLEYIHHHSGVIHNRMKSSSVLVTEPNFHAKICYFGAADLAGEVPVTTSAEDKEAASGEICPSSPPSRKMRRAGSGRMKIEGSRGYMAPELLAGGNISRRSDVYALGVVLLELLSGDEPLKYRFDKEGKDVHRVSLIETAREAIRPEEDSSEQERRGRVRRWVDRRLRDSYPVEAAEDLVRVALRCVEADAAARPDMTWVAGKVSKIFLDSKVSFTSENKTSSASDLAHVTCFSNSVEGPKVHEELLAEYLNSPFLSASANPSEAPPPSLLLAKMSLPSSSHASQGAPSLGGLQYSGGSLVQLLESNGYGLKRSFKSEREMLSVSQETGLTTDMNPEISSVVSNNDMGRQSFDSQEVPSISAGPLHIDESLWNY